MIGTLKAAIAAVALLGLAASPPPVDSTQGTESINSVQVCDAPPPSVAVTKVVGHFVAFPGIASTTVLPGSSFTFSANSAKTVASTLSATGTVEADAVFAKVQATVGASATKSLTVQAGFTYTYVNTTGSTKTVALGSTGWDVTTTTTYWVSPCTQKKQSVTNFVPRNNVSIGYV
ncbi:hypothetical protein JT358_14160 [Micrococcales bacterium 31B]|nr:hypothetical protein [Micrococcales bacterium 31B]